MPEALTIDERREKTMHQPVKVMLEQGKNGMLTHRICLKHIGSRVDRRPYSHSRLSIPWEALWWHSWNPPLGRKIARKRLSPNLDRSSRQKEDLFPFQENTTTSTAISGNMRAYRSKSRGEGSDPCLRSPVCFEISILKRVFSNRNMGYSQNL